MNKNKLKRFNSKHVLNIKCKEWEEECSICGTCTDDWTYVEGQLVCWSCVDSM